MPATPFSLYDMTVATVCDFYKYFKQDLRLIPETVLFDICITLYKQGRIYTLCIELRDLTTFSKMLKLTKNRVMLIKCFQALMEHETGIAKGLIGSYKLRCEYFKLEDSNENVAFSIIDQGLKLGGFLSDASWYHESCEVLEACQEVCLAVPENPSSLMRSLDCCHKLLHAQIIYSLCDKATKTKLLAEEIISKLKRTNEKMCLAGIYTQFSIYSFSMSLFDEAYMWSVRSIQELNHNSNSRMVVEALSQAAKSCVVKRRISKAESLIRMAVYFAAKVFGKEHPKYAETLLDYGFYLLNSDAMKDSVTVYEKALSLKEEIFGPRNLQVAIAHEELAYALYVHEYCSGNFNSAKYHADQSIALMTALLPPNHLMIASAIRVKALILEEIALSNISTMPGTHKLLCEAEKLHKNALRVSLACFGENNVQTAKHYGNLGRLYQTMKKYKEAEAMHMKAIQLKEKLLGQDDYEVGLSLGHLASLYNYHMKEHRKAEALYIRSINISLKLFTESYSGLEYDYRGLLHAYDQLGELDNVINYSELIDRWKMLRDERNERETAPLALNDIPCTLECMKAIFLDDSTTMDEENC
ncbi:amyloid protein-binding protein 2 isoform X2 [Cimex lectularius]|uniref:Amyloid protein-binding protein 2 n=1 Tax=Cimex lectularius TaxID=79782 RepID=A0A8I6RGW3_CIMLE|nr:amyloid protein-binding protein 2 isoform X2 [Cimex lectularius]